jgi:hypothetical protein
MTLGPEVVLNLKCYEKRFVAKLQVYIESTAPSITKVIPQTGC